VAGVGIVVALACLGAGIGIGFAVSGDHHRDRPGRIVMLPGRGFERGPALIGPRGDYGVWPLPGYPGAPQSSGAASPSPAPSSTG
jgi:hypothetical protein